ncbi:Uncharacterised protein [BD1-7 clade bacterium]|uniref:Thiol:disulfide interchange protein DsbD N-terminal domain-containing protein n=1 Tax=BD1-7 clade bacterium TaxID=2029982 RepID=A0A5S9NV58_9GAMM|nr:Uncharacterised protein [BD1-7 clade bacterium]CAA0094446.1 Uncharacterised protein [BD1-7 clade bacterium]
MPEITMNSIVRFPVAHKLALFLVLIFVASSSIFAEDAQSSESDPTIYDGNTEPTPGDMDVKAAEEANEPFEQQDNLTPTNNSVPASVQVQQQNDVIKAQQQKADAEKAEKLKAEKTEAGQSAKQATPPAEQASSEQQSSKPTTPTASIADEAAPKPLNQRWLFTLSGHLAKLSLNELVFYSRQPVLGIDAETLRSFTLEGLTLFTDHWQKADDPNFVGAPPFAALVYQVDDKIFRYSFEITGAEPFHEAIKFKIKMPKGMKVTPIDIKGATLFIDASKCAGCIDLETITIVGAEK